jgi:integrase
MKTGDITALKGSSVQGDRVLGWRPKTKVPFNMKLWPLTQRLIERCRDTQGEDDYLFTNQAGGRIETDSYGQVFRKIAIRAQVNQAKKKSRKGEPLPAIFSQLRDTSVDLVDKMLLEEGHDGGLLQVFQQHKDGSTAAYYTNRTPETMRVAKLDQITDDLLVKYGLKL